MLLPSEIPRLDGVPDSAHDPSAYYEVETWSRFVDKAAKGSYKAYDILEYAHWALVVELRGARWSEEALVAEFQAVVADGLPAAPPYGSLAELFRILKASGCLDATFRVAERPLAPREQYSIPWENDYRLSMTRPAQALARARLVHDAAHCCHAEWGPAGYLRLWAAIDERGTPNAVDLVSAMLMLIIAWSPHPIWEELVSRGRR